MYHDQLQHSNSTVTFDSFFLPSQPKSLTRISPHHSHTTAASSSLLALKSQVHLQETNGGKVLRPVLIAYFKTPYMKLNMKLGFPSSHLSFPSSCRFKQIFHLLVQLCLRRNTGQGGVKAGVHSFGADISDHAHLSPIF